MNANVATPAMRGIDDGGCADVSGPTREYTMFGMVVGTVPDAAMALLRLEGATLASAASLHDHAIAQIVARNVAVETLTDPIAPSLGMSDGTEVNASRKWRWTRKTSLAVSG